MTNKYGIPALRPGKRVYTVAEAAEILDVSTNTMYKMVKQNVFNYRKVGRDIRISKTSFDNWLDRQEQ